MSACKSNSDNKSKKSKKTKDNENFEIPVKKQRILTVVNPETGEVEARIQLRDRYLRAGWFAFFQKSAVYLAQNLNGEQLRVLMYMLSKVDYGNYIRVTNKNIARNLKMSPGGVTRAIRGLLEKNVFAVEEYYGISRIYRMNPTFLHKGRDVYQTHAEYAQLKDEALKEALKDDEDEF